MKKVLCIMKFIPAPGYSGGAKRNQAWLRFLSKYYDVTVVGFWDKKFEDTRIDELKEFSKEIYGVTFKRKIIMLIGKYVNCFIKNEPLMIYQYYSNELKKLINSLIKGNQYEFILCSELSTMQYIKNNTKIPIAFDDHNIEYELIQRRVEKEHGIVRKVFEREFRLVKKIELNAWGKSSFLSLVSEREREICSKYVEEDKIRVINNTYYESNNNDLEWFNDPSIVFVGSISWKPNLMGLTNFIKNIYPVVKGKIPNVKMYILGSSVTDNIRNLCSQYYIQCMENINESEKSKIISRSWLAIVPVYFGSGTRIKILEYWMHKKTVVSTEVGAEGLCQSEGTFIVNGDEQFAKSMIDLLNDKIKLNELGKSNYDNFKKFYSEEVVYEDSLHNAITTKFTGEI